jgi:SpoIID/LytB domain protein
MRRRFWVLLVAATALVPASTARASVPVLVIDGRGFGHGVGMAQDGAFWMGKAGASTKQILGQFYPGTALARATGSVAVAVYDGASATLAFPAGGRIDTEGSATSGFPIRVQPGGRVRVRRDGSTLVIDAADGDIVRSPQPTTTTTATVLAPGDNTKSRGPASLLLPTTTTTSANAATATPRPAAPPAPRTSSALVVTQPSDGAVTIADRQRAYRGALRIALDGTGLRVVNHLDVEQYLRGMGEVRDPSWPAASLRSQAIAARTYALRAMAGGGELCDTTRCQVYLGRQAEYAAMDRAVADTKGQVLTFGGRLASAVYSANGGGHSATREEGFGAAGGDYPYLRAAPYETKDPMPWTVVVGLGDLAAHLDHVATTGASIAQAGPSGRALAVTLDGPAGPRTVAGRAFAAALGLRSTMFTLRLAAVDKAPPPLAGGTALQDAPDDLGAGSAADVTAGPLVARAATIEGPATRPQLAPARHAGAGSGAGAFLGLALALALLLSATWRPGGSARRRSWPAARPAGGAKR